MTISTTDKIGVTLDGHVAVVELAAATSGPDDPSAWTWKHAPDRRIPLNDASSGASTGAPTRTSSGKTPMRPMIPRSLR